MPRKRPLFCLLFCIATGFTGLMISVRASLTSAASLGASQPHAGSDVETTSSTLQRSPAASLAKRLADFPQTLDSDASAANARQALVILKANIVSFALIDSSDSIKFLLAQAIVLDEKLISYYRTNCTTQEMTSLMAFDPNTG